MNKQQELCVQTTGSVIAVIEKNCNKPYLKFFKTEFAKIIDIKKNNPDFNAILGVFFTKLVNLSGLKGELSSINKQDISEFIMSYCQHLSLEDIHLAFKLERYGVYSERTNHYQNFNAEYVSVILNKYKDFKRKYFVQNNIKTKPKLKEKTFSKEEKKEIMERAIVRLSQIVSESGSVPEFGYVYIYDFLETNNRLEQLSPVKREHIVKKAKGNIKESNHRQNNINNTIINKIAQADSKSKLINECKRLVLEGYIKKQLQKNE